MKILHYFFISIFTISICSFTDSNTEMKKISNPLYSFSIPADWECAHPGKIKDCTVPLERDAYIYHLYYLQWRSPDINSSFYIWIETYQRLDDNVSVTLEEVETVVMNRAKLTDPSGIMERKEISSSANQKRFFIKKETEYMNVLKGKSMVMSNYFYLLHKNKNKVHCLCISIEGNTIPLEKQKIINNMLDSFSVNE